MKLEFCKNCGKRIIHFSPSEFVSDGYYCACDACEKDFYEFETESVEPKNHVEILDEKTIILSVKECDLDKIDSNLIVNGTPCCVNKDKKCENFYNFYKTLHNIGKKFSFMTLL